MPFDPLPTIDLDETIQPAGKAERSNRATFSITGPTGVGKTTSVTTIPEDSKALYLDFDGKAKIISELAPEKVSIVNLKFDINDYKTQLATVKTLYDKAFELSSTYQWCFIDGLTNFYKLGCQNAHDNVAGKNRYKMNFDKMDHVDNWVFKNLQRFGAAFQYFVLFSHEEFMESEGSVIKILPLCRKALSKAIPGNFQEVFHAQTVGLGEDQSYVWFTKGEENCSNTSSIPGLPHRIPNNFDLLLNTNWTKVSSVKEAIGNHKGVKVTGWNL